MSTASPVSSLLPGDALPPAGHFRAAITAACRRDETEAVHALLRQAPAQPDPAARQLAHRLVAAVRGRRSRASGVDALMHEFSLSSEEGVALMCMAEALLRIPDRATVDRLIADKLGSGDWRKHLGDSPSLFVNAAAWGLLISGRLVTPYDVHGLGAALARLIAKGGEPLIRTGMELAMRMLGRQFIAGRTINEALAVSRAGEARGYRYSYDMLGEAALTADDASAYFHAYEQAIHAIGAAAAGRGIRNGPGISIKLSALHPRYARAQRARVLEELLPRLTQLALLAQRYQIGLNIDAEEADRLELSLDLLEALAATPALAGFDGIGFVVQAYQKRCPFVIDYLAELARRSGRRFMVRLVKGAYWDSEIKRAQAEGLDGYPVYTRKPYTDVSYLVCARKLLACSDLLYPQFATHNAQTLATIFHWAADAGVTGYEFQCLHGMGETLYDQVVGKEGLDRPCRLYAPVGSHRTLLAYLVRRLLENGANTSFVNRVVDPQASIDELVADPFELARRLGGAPHPQIPLPAQLFGTERRNSGGLDLADDDVLRSLVAQFEPLSSCRWQAFPLLAEKAQPNKEALPISNPANRCDQVGQVIEADPNQVESALQAAQAAAMDWQTTAPAQRAATLERAAELFEAQRAELMALAIREAGKTLPNALAEVREAVDFLRYYAAQARTLPPALALGPVVCISPWNFPLAIFVGQVSAALAAGNTVLAKPAEQTPLIAFRAVQLLHRAGIPRAALQFLPGSGERVGTQLTADPRVHGVLFTGSTEVAQAINRALAARPSPRSHDVALIAETGGQNAMIVDSSALPEQVVQDVLTSAFDSAGQRCSALRVLCLQEEIAERMLTMLKGAMQELQIGDPGRLSTDVGPVIDHDAQQQLSQHLQRMKPQASLFYQLPLPAGCTHGSFVAPALIEIASLQQLQHEVFGPVLHVLRYRRESLPQLLNAIHATGYGLTLSIHSRIDETVSFISGHARVGNIYVNRNMVGAVVGVQPFGGEGKSGTGPKAGGPLYLKRLQRHAPGSAALPWRQAEAPLPAGLEALLAWARLQGHEKIAALCERYAGETPLGAVLPLPGPTGERNTLSFVPRGVAFCAAGTADGLLNQLSAAFATGNKALVDGKTSLLLPDNLPATVRKLIEIGDTSSVRQALFQVALIDAALAGQLVPALAARDGMVVPVLETTTCEPLPLWRLVAERALCVNTAAAGGNASLMTLAP